MWGRSWGPSWGVSWGGYSQQDAWGGHFVHWGVSWGAPLTTQTAEAPTGGGHRLSRHYIELQIRAYEQRLNAETEAQVKKEVKKVVRKAKQAVKAFDGGVLSVPKIVAPPRFQHLVAQVNEQIFNEAAAILRAIEQDDEDVLTLLQ